MAVLGRGAGLALTLLLLPALSEAREEERRDLHFAEALFHARQEHWFEALERLDAEMAQHYAVDEPQLDTLYPHLGRAEFAVGDFELSYRMHHRAGRAIRRVLEGDVAEPVRNEAAYRLARIHFQKGQPFAALRALDRIEGQVPDGLRDDVDFLRANVLLSIGRNADAAEILADLRSQPDLEGFSAYNLGIALLRSGQQEEALAQLDRAGRLRARDEASLAIRDKSNLVLGTLLFESEDFGPSQQFLDRVRLEGPFSNQALLRAGWADLSATKFDRALVPWSLLVDRQPTDAAVQEAKLALPYAYSKLGVHGRAARLYGRAVESFGQEIAKLDASIASIEGGAFLDALVREEIRQSKDWVIRLRRLPETPETFYLVSLMASHDFQTALQNFLDLEDLRKKLTAWQIGLEAFDELIALRRAYYEPLVPGVDRQFRELDARIRLRSAQRDVVEKRLQELLVAPRPELLATSAERASQQRLDQLEVALENATGEFADEQRRRIRRLRGSLEWTVVTRYHDRLTETHAHLRELNASMAAMRARYDAFVRTRQAATHSYAGHGGRIGDLRQRVAATLGRLDLLMESQGQMLESVAIAELRGRRERLETYLNQARFAFADSYDRAAKAQVQ